MQKDKEIYLRNVHLNIILASDINPLSAGSVYIHFCIFLFCFLEIILSNLNNFHPLEVMDGVSETQLHVGENSN